MTGSERLLAHFDRISEAPDAIQRLRRFVLDLAVRGKLAPQDPSDEPASTLVQRIQVEKRAQGIRAAKVVALHETDVPLAVPDGWMWARIGQLTSDRGQAIPSESFTYIDVTSINKEVGRIADPKVLSAADAPSRARKRVQRGDVLYSCVRPYLLNVAVLDRNFTPPPIASTAFAVLNGFGLVVPRYFWIALRSPAMVTQVESKMRGQAYPAINDSDFRALPLPLPPLAEQHRIVAKVDELMALCDRLEAAQKDRESRRDRLVSASLARLNQPADPPLFREHGHFYLRHLPRMATSRPHIQRLRETILGLAVSGRLVAQDPSDEPAEALMARADCERWSTAETDRRADADPQTLLASNDRWAVPSSWVWRGLADIALFIDYRGQTPVKTDQGIRLITAKNVRPGAISFAPEEFISEATYQEWMTRGLPTAGDVLFTTEAPMGNAAVIRLSERFALAQRVICFRSYGALEPDFLELQLLARPFQSILKKTATGLTAKGIKAAKLKRLPVVVPPLAEQRRIVAKVDDLMAVCEGLERQLEAGRAAHGALLEATLQDALAGQEQAPMIAAE